MNEPQAVVLADLTVSRSNNADATAFCSDANEFLAALCNGTRLESLDNDTPALNRQVDFICAGVPCQGHSGLNHYRKAEHRNNNQLLTALSLVEAYQPRYFCLENVSFIRE